jgi:hypothetical protein
MPVDIGLCEGAPSGWRVRASLSDCFRRGAERPCRLLAGSRKSLARMIFAFSLRFRALRHSAVAVTDQYSLGTFTTGEVVIFGIKFSLLFLGLAVVR